MFRLIALFVNKIDFFLYDFKTTIPYRSAHVAICTISMPKRSLKKFLSAVGTI